MHLTIEGSCALTCKDICVTRHSAETHGVERLRALRDSVVSLKKKLPCYRELGPCFSCAAVTAVGAEDIGVCDSVRALGIHIDISSIVLECVIRAHTYNKARVYPAVVKQTTTILNNS